MKPSTNNNRFRTAVYASVGIHVLIGALLCLYLVKPFDGADSDVELEVAEVEISFADEVSETAPLAPQAPAPAIPPPEVTSSPPPPAPVETERQQVEIPKTEKLPEPPPSKPQVAAPSAPAPVQARLDAPPRPAQAIKPDYPKGARQRGEQGNVMLEIVINEQGKADRVTVVGSSGFSELDDAAVSAVQRARFNPAKSGGRPVRATVRLKLAFKLK